MFTAREVEIVVTLLDSEIMKSNLYYGCNNRRTEELYKIRDKVLELREEGNYKSTTNYNNVSIK